jgi:hydrogenase/urease accessory protein HupE
MTAARRLALPLAVLATAAVAQAAAAQGLPADPGGRSVPGYLWLGISHMVGGWDHVLFIAGIVFLAGELRSAAKLISVFVAGHSLTLLGATLAGWQVSAPAVDVVIALSIAFIGWRNLRGRPQRWAPTAAAVFAFGLVHGLGLASRLQDLALPDGGALVARILAFNVGVEIGQLTALGVIVAVGLLVAPRLPNPRLAPRTAAQGLVATGLFAAIGLSLIYL